MFVIGEVLEHITLVVEAKFSEFDGVVLGVAVVDERSQSAPGRVQSRMVGIVLI